VDLDFDALDARLTGGLEREFGGAGDKGDKVSGEKSAVDKGDKSSSDKPSPDKPSSDKSSGEGAGDRLSAGKGSGRGGEGGRGGWTPKELRESYERTKAERDEAMARVAEYERKLAEAEARGKDTTVLAEKLAKAEEELRAAQSELRAARREFSPEFVEKYHKPFNEAAEFARSDIEQLVVMDDEAGERQATWDDFVALYRLPKGRALMEVRRLFGEEQAPLVISHLNELQRLERVRVAAERQERASWEQREREEAARLAQQREAVDAMWRRANEDLRAKRPEWFAPDPEDEEGNRLLEDGYKLVDVMFDRNAALTPQQRVLLHAQVRNRAAAFPRMARKAALLTRRVQELEAALAELRGSGPTGGGRRGDCGSGVDDGADPVLDLKAELKKALD
jgi:hypothetical protein